METAIISIICIALLIFGGMAMSHGFMTSVDTSASGLQQIGNSVDSLIRTELTPVSTNLTADAGGDPLQIILKNTGQTKMADFDKWDIIVQYYDDAGNYHVQWLPFVNGTNAVYEWDVGWIELNGGPELFDPGVLDPGEEIMIKTRLFPLVGPNTTSMVTISTPSGVTCSTYFSF